MHKDNKMIDNENFAFHNEKSVEGRGVIIVEVIIRAPLLPRMAYAALHKNTFFYSLSLSLVVETQKM